MFETIKKLFKEENERMEEKKMNNEEVKKYEEALDYYLYNRTKKVFKEEERVKSMSERFDEEHSNEIRGRLIKLHEKLKRVCEDNGIMMVEYYNFDYMVKNPELYMVFDLEAFIIDIKRYAKAYREGLKDGAMHKIEFLYSDLWKPEHLTKVAMCARLMTDEECEAARDAEYIECRDEKGKLIGIRTKYGIEAVPDDYEVRMKLDNLEKKLDKIIAKENERCR